MSSICVCIQVSSSPCFPRCLPRCCRGCAPPVAVLVDRMGVSSAVVGVRRSSRPALMQGGSMFDAPTRRPAASFAFSGRGWLVSDLARPRSPSSLSSPSSAVIHTGSIGMRTPAIKLRLRGRHHGEDVRTDVPALPGPQRRLIRRAQQHRWVVLTPARRSRRCSPWHPVATTTGGGLLMTGAAASVRGVAVSR